MDYVTYALLKKKIEEIGIDVSSFEFKGSTRFEDLPTDANKGDMWNILNDFDLNGVHYPAGTNVAWNGEKWNALGGSGIADIPSGNSLPSGTREGQMFILLQDVVQASGTVKKGLYRFNGSSWNLIADTEAAMFIEAESHTDIHTYAVPVLTDEQIEKAYNGIMAGKNVFVVDDLDFITIQVLDASSIEGYPTIRLIFTDALLLTYHTGGEIVARNLFTEFVQTISNTAEVSAEDKAVSEKALAQYIASGNNGAPRTMDGVNLNSVTATGFYFCNICTNRPVNANGIMLVGRYGGGHAYVWQQYNAFAEDKVFVRFRDNNTWKPWQRVLMDSDNYLKTITKDEEDKTITIEDSQGNIVEFEYGASAVENAYDSIENVGNIDESYLAYTEYSGLDYGYAKEFFDNLDTAPNFGMCSSAIIDGHLVRNYDWHYSNANEFVVRTPAINNRHSVVGTVGQVSDLTKDFVKDREYSEKYKVMPFFLVDGYNDAGLKMEINVVPNDKGDTTGTLVNGEEINALMFIRWALDYCSTVDEVKSALENDISIVVPQIMRDMGYEVHFLMHDKTMGDDEGWVLEFVNNTCIWTNHNKMTNFFITGVAFKEDGTVPVIGDSDISNYGLTEHSQGLERYNIIVNHRGTETELLEALKYTNLYTLSANKWYSELCSGDLLITSPMSDFETAMTTAREQYGARARDTALTDQTVHSVIYDSDGMNIYAQENYDNRFIFELPINITTQLDAAVAKAEQYKTQAGNSAVSAAESKNAILEKFVECESIEEYIEKLNAGIIKRSSLSVITEPELVVI